jgi:hypothetical protein
MPHLIISIISPGFSDPIVSWTATELGNHPRSLDTYEKNNELGSIAGTPQMQGSNLGTNIYHGDTLSTENDTISPINPASGKYVLSDVGLRGLTFSTSGGNTTAHFSDGSTWTVLGGISPYCKATRRRKRGNDRNMVDAVV